MRRALAAIASGTGSHRELQSAAHELVLALRQENQPPEQMLLHVKEILAEAGMRPTYASLEMDGPLGDGASIYRDVIAWSIRSYYDEGEGSASQ